MYMCVYVCMYTYVENFLCLQLPLLLSFCLTFRYGSVNEYFNDILLEEKLANWYPRYSVKKMTTILLTFKIRAKIGPSESLGIITFTVISRPFNQKWCNRVGKIFIVK